MQARVTALEEDVQRIRKRQADHEEGVIQARQRHFEQQSVIAQGVIAQGAELGLVHGKVDVLTREVSSMSAEVQALTGLVRRRFETDDEREGKLLAELAALHKQDGTLEKANAAVVEEVSEIKDTQIAAIEKLEVERAGKTVRAGAVSALGAAIFSYLKANPDAFEQALHALGKLFP